MTNLCPLSWCQPCHLFVLMGKGDNLKAPVPIVPGTLGLVWIWDIYISTRLCDYHLRFPDTSWPPTSFCSSAADSPSPSSPWDISFSRNRLSSTLLVSDRLCSDVIGLFQSNSLKILNDHITFSWPFRLNNTNMSAVAKVAKPVMRGMHVNVIKKNLILATAVSIRNQEQDLF